LDKEYFIGLDLSMTGTGMIIIDNNLNIINQELISSSPSDGSNEKRIIKLKNNIFSFLPEDLKMINKIGIEGISYGSKGRSIAEMSALNYFIRISCLENNLSYMEIPPTTLKKFITGKGNSPKDLMLLKTYKKFGVEFDNNNLCDAYCLARFVLEESKK